MTDFFYIGAYTDTGHSKGFSYYSIDFSAKNATLLQLSELEGPTYAAYSPDHCFLYTAQENDGSRSLSAFKVDGEGYLSFINTVSVPSADICHVSVAPDGSFLIGSSYSQGFVVTVSLSSDGSLGEIVTLHQHEGHGTLPEQDIPRAHCCVFDKTGTYIICADYGNDTMYVYTHKDCGVLTCLHTYTVSSGLAPRIAVFSPDNRHVYVLTQGGNVVIHYLFDEKTGELTEKTSYDCLPDGFTAKSEAAEVQFSPEGRYLYASSRGSDTIACYKPLPDGSLERLYVRNCGGEFPRHFTITKDGGYLLCGNQNSNTVTVFSRVTETGIISDEPQFSFEVGAPTFIMQRENHTL